MRGLLAEAGLCDSGGPGAKGASGPRLHRLAGGANNAVFRVDLEHGWCLIRASNTSPVIRLTVEADSDAELSSLMNKFEAELVAQFDAVRG